ncbi:MAG TPA: serine/threonine-protein kinase [Verrucomicrobiae bacterium]|nr:serine/threonine-protein kinase [Verrucomicrobiae bacterium]
MTFAPSETPGKYEFLGVIDKPKAGVTYKVRNRETGEIESLRALPGAASSHPETMERFLREIKIHTRLSHPNILAFHDVFELDDQLVMTAEYVEGTTLAALCREGPVLSSEAVRIVGEVLSGLEEAHELGIVHRGITAEHVIVTPAGDVKLGGFGLAKPADDMNLTQSGSVLGEPRYISPEQVMGTAALDARSDLYSVGVLLYYALTGKVPFDNPNEFDVMVAQVNSVPRPPSLLNPGISPELDRVVLTALAKKPEERYPTAREFRQALNSTVAVPAPEPVEEPTVECAPPQFFVEPRSTPSPTGAFALGLLSVAVGLAVLYFAMH